MTTMTAAQLLKVARLQAAEDEAKAASGDKNDETDDEEDPLAAIVLPPASSLSYSQLTEFKEWNPSQAPPSH